MSTTGRVKRMCCSVRVMGSSCRAGEMKHKSGLCREAQGPARRGPVGGAPEWVVWWVGRTAGGPDPADGSAEIMYTWQWRISTNHGKLISRIQSRW